MDSVSADRTKTLVLAHGHHRGSPGWEEVVWGGPRGPGRLPVAAEAALRLGASALILGSGLCASDGSVESEVSLALLQDRLASTPLALHPQIQAAGSARGWVDAIARPDRDSKTTREEIRAALRICREEDFGLLALCSSSSHLPRCLRDAAAEAEIQGWRGRICGFASPAPFPGTSAADTVVLEPPHRPDRPSPPLASLVAALLAAGPDAVEEGCRFLAYVISKAKERED